MNPCTEALVVSHSNSTSNHNVSMWPVCFWKVVSHSNSTSNHNKLLNRDEPPHVVSHSNSTSNHNRRDARIGRPQVVSHSNSTSNHNLTPNSQEPFSLFLIPILHQTTTYTEEKISKTSLFLIPILHQTTTGNAWVYGNARCFSFQFYIKPQLLAWRRLRALRCFSFQFYIKPQQTTGRIALCRVVSHSNSTSNHNRRMPPSSLM